MTRNIFMPPVSGHLAHLLSALSVSLAPHADRHSVPVEAAVAALWWRVVVVAAFAPEPLAISIHGV